MIINDKRYGALKTLGERKQVFNEVSLIHGCMYKINYIPRDGFMELGFWEGGVVFSQS